LEQIINLNNKIIDISKPIIMAIVNVTPDSFYSGNSFTTKDELLFHTEKALKQGATIIDIGAQSTRPNALLINENEEAKRLVFALDLIRKEFGNIPISVDTFYASIAQLAVSEYDVAMINDVSGGNFDKEMFSTVSSLKTAYILTHSRGDATNMQNLTDYNDIVSDILSFFQLKIHQLRNLGVNDIVIDPGFGFAKTREQNFILLKKLDYFKEINIPILCGISRKSMIYNTLQTTAAESLNGTTAANMLALQGGARILRVHDVWAAKEAITIFNEYLDA